MTSAALVSSRADYFRAILLDDGPALAGGGGTQCRKLALGGLLTTLATRRAEGHPTCAFDAALVRRALWNLIVNALKYGDASGAVTVSRSGDDTGFVVEVHNEGAPITPEVQRTLFKPFARARTATKTSGRGIGLALVAGCASAHGGSVTLRSEAGAGTTFRLSIPSQCVLDHSATSLH